MMGELRQHLGALRGTTSPRPQRESATAGFQLEINTEINEICGVSRKGRFWTPMEREAFASACRDDAERGDAAICYAVRGDTEIGPTGSVFLTELTNARWLFAVGSARPATEREAMAHLNAKKQRRSRIRVSENYRRLMFAGRFRNACRVSE